MPVNKPHLEFHRVDMSAGWSTPPGYPPGIDPATKLHVDVNTAKSADPSQGATH